MNRSIDAADDRLHPIGDDHPMWTETAWWGLMAPDAGVGGMVYSFFRPNLGVATVVTQVWDAEAVEPWRAPYARGLWHLPMPDGDLDDLHVGPLHVRCLDPLRRYEVAYDDGEALCLRLAYTAAMEPHVMAAEPALGHFDQLCRVSGELALGGRTIPIDAYAVRDRSWYVRDDFRSSRSAYTYGAVDEGEHFLAYSRPAKDGAVHGGYLVRDGEKADLVSGTRHVVTQRRGHPDEVEVRATDALGRTLTASGRVTASLASQSTPGMFAWMSIADWEIDGRRGHGEDHDVWSPDQLAAEHRRPGNGP
jgi:hypothetical protein